MAEMKHLRLSWIVHTMLVTAALCPLALGRTIRVAHDGPVDHTTIQAAIDASVGGDTILVAPGTYTGDGNRDIDFKGKAITVRGETGSGTCIIDCQSSEAEPHRGFHFHSGEDERSVLAGVSIIHGYAEFGGGILCEFGSPAITDCIVSENKAVLWGGGIHAARANPRVTNCILAENEAGVRGGGISCTGDGPFRIDNCTIVGNHARDSAGGIGLGGGDGDAIIRNTILWGNRAPKGNQIVFDGRACTSVLGCAGITVEYCCIEPGQNSLYDTREDLLPGTFAPLKDIFQHNGNISDDPLFSGDYRLKSEAGRWDPNRRIWVKDGVTSPCIDTGDPNSPVGGEPAPNGGRINMGAYGGTAEASKSVAGLSSKYGGGSGVAGNPYLIFTAEQFDAVGAEPPDWDKYFKLMADIDLGDYTGQELRLIGIDATSPFSGVFDGNGHRISGLGRHNPAGSTSAALFGYLTGTVKGVGLIDPNVGGRLLYYTGALVGENRGTVSDCYAEDVNVVGGGWYAGGLVGCNMGTITHCRSTGVVHDRCAGGLVGKNGGTITDCSSAVTVVGVSPVGGLVGSTVQGAITNSCSTGAATGDDRTGGLIGYNYEGTITCCYSTAVVVGNDGVGGLVGENWQGFIENCYSAANVTGDRLTGGLVGDSGGGAITNCYAGGPVVGRWPAGGIVSWRHDDDIVTGCFWDMETTGCEWSAAGTGKTTAEMQTAATFLTAGWDFAGETTNGAGEIWRIPEKSGYPRLSWELSAVSAHQ